VGRQIAQVDAVLVRMTSHEEVGNPAPLGTASARFGMEPPLTFLPRPQLLRFHPCSTRGRRRAGTEA
jgi:hypothetical protein